LAVPLSLQGPAAVKGHVKSLTVRVSYDGGRTWRTVTVHADHAGKRYVTLTHPKKPGTVSFRASLTDTDGNTAAQTIRTAYRTVRQPSGQLHAVPPAVPVGGTAVSVPRPHNGPELPRIGVRT
jgi:hypothetical protein